MNFVFVGVIAKRCMTSPFRPVNRSLEGLHAKYVKAFTSGSFTSNKEVKFLATDLYSFDTCANSCAFLLKFSILL